MEVLLYIVVWAVIFGTIGYALAPSKGREPVMWAVICAITGIIGVIVLLVLPRQNQPTP
ncbi:MAG: hypothetical protein ABI725_03025 [Chloroflexota bacterium]